MINAIPTELSGTQPVSRSSPSQQSLQIGDSTDQGASFQSFLRTASNPVRTSESKDQAKPESKPERKRDSSGATSVQSDHQDQRAVALNLVIPVQPDTATAEASNIVLSGSAMTFDVTKAAATGVPAGSIDMPRLALTGDAEAVDQKLAAVQGPSAADTPQTAQPAHDISNDAAVLVPALIISQNAHGLALSSQAAMGTTVAGHDGRGLALSSQAATGTSVPGHSGNSAVPGHANLKDTLAADQSAPAVADSVSASAQVAVEAAVQFRLPKLQSLEPVPGGASVSKVKNDRVVSSASATENTATAPGTMAGAKGKDQHGRMDNGQDSNATSTGQQAPSAPVITNPASGQSGSAHADANGFQAAVAAGSPRNATESGNSQPLKAEVSQPNVPTAPAATAVAQVQDLQAKINTAKLLQGVEDSELRVGMRSGEFGDIAIHTSLSRSSIWAQISVEHGELAKAIAASLPELRSVLGNQDHLEVRVAMHDQVSPQMDFGGRGAGQGSQRESRSTPNASSLSGDDTSAAPSAISTVQIDTARPTLTGRVDVLI